jgi:hypothetical protein
MIHAQQRTTDIFTRYHERLRKEGWTVSPADFRTALFEAFDVYDQKKPRIEGPKAFGFQKLDGHR